MFDRLAARLRLPVSVVALLSVFLVDAILTAGIVTAVLVSSSPGPSSVADKVWTERELKDRYLLKSMDDIRKEFGTPAFSTVDRNGDIDCLRYYGISVAPDGRKRNVYFFARGNRCSDCGFDGPR